MKSRLEADIMEYSNHNWYQAMCCKLTKHKWRKCCAYSISVTPNEYYYRCRICGYKFWNTKRPANFHPDLEW